jgi:hypothetical protein
MRPGVIPKIRSFAIVSSLLVTLAACSGEDASQEKSASSARAGSAAALSAVATTDMVAAVGSGKSAAPIEVRFDLAKRPEVGVPLDVTVSVLPVGDVERLQMVFQSLEGLSVTGNSNLGPINQPKVGEELRHVVTVTPQKEGVYYVSAVALIETADVSVSRSFAIPVVVGAVPAGLAGASVGTANATESTSANPPNP